MGQERGSGYRALAIVLIVVGVLGVLALGTCAVGAFWVKRKADAVVASIADGGLVMVSPPAVKAELAGAKKDYVGAWASARGSTLDIDADGNMKLVKDEDGDGGSREAITAPIASFRGDDIEVKLVVTLTIPVTVPPHRVGSPSKHWEMTAKGVVFERK